MTRFRPYSNWTEKELKAKLIQDINKLKISAKLKKLWINVIEEAFDSDRWDIIKDYNGCTAVQDMFHPCPACFVHDFSWLSGMGGRVSDRVFYGLMLAEGMSKGKSFARWAAVRVGWFSFFRWKYIFRRNWRRPSEGLQELYNHLKGK